MEYKIGDSVNYYNMDGVIIHIINDGKAVVIYFKETDEEIAIDIDELEE